MTSKFSCFLGETTVKRIEFFVYFSMLCVVYTRKVGVFDRNFCYRAALVRGTQILKMFEIGPAVPEIWSFLVFGPKMGPKLG